MKIELNRKVKYKGEYYNANTPFTVAIEDVEDFKLMGAVIFEEAEETTLDIYIESPEDKLKDLVNLLKDQVMLNELIEKDNRKFAKKLYSKKLEQILKAEEGEQDAI